MVQFIPQEQGASPFPSTPFSTAMTGIGDILGGAGQAAQGAAMMKPPNLPPPVPGQQDPLANIRNMTMGQMHNMPQGLLPHILGAGGMTVYYDPVTKTASMTPTPGSIPISGFKGPQALAGMGKTNMDAARQAYMEKHQSYMDRMQTFREKNPTLTPEQKIQQSLVSAYSRILSNPTIDLPPDESQAMQKHLDEQITLLEKGSGNAGAPPAAPSGSNVLALPKASEVERVVSGKIAIFDSKTKQFIRWK